MSRREFPPSYWTRSVHLRSDSLRQQLLNQIIGLVTPLSAEVSSAQQNFNALVQTPYTVLQQDLLDEILKFYRISLAYIVTYSDANYVISGHEFSEAQRSLNTIVQQIQLLLVMVQNQNEVRRRLSY